MSIKYMCNLTHLLIQHLDDIIDASFRKSNCRFRVDSVDSNHTLTSSTYVILFGNKYYQLFYDYDDDRNSLKLNYVSEVKPHVITKTEWR